MKVYIKDLQMRYHSNSLHKLIYNAAGQLIALLLKSSLKAILLVDTECPLIDDITVIYHRKPYRLVIKK